MKTLLTGRCLVEDKDVYRIGVDYEGDFEIEIENEDEEEYMSVYIEEDKAVELANAILEYYGKKEELVSNTDNFIDEFRKGGLAVHCITRKEANVFFDYLEENSNLKWASGHLPTKHNPWSVYETETCFEIRDGLLLYGDIPFFKEEGLDIIKYEDLNI